MKTSESVKNIVPAMLKVQGKIKGMIPDANNPFFKNTYITLDGILEYVRPMLSDNNLLLMQDASGDGETVTVTTTVYHSSGEYLTTDTLTMKPKQNDAQQMGSCITYAKRYQLAALLGISSEVDDDANKATWGKGAPNKQGQKPTSNAGNDGHKCSKCNSNVTDKVANFTKSKYGKVLCFKCQQGENK